MAKFNNPYDFNFEEKPKYYSPSMTVPNMAMSLQEILTRYTQGTLPNSNQFMQELPYNNGKLSPIGKKGVGLEDYSSIMKQASDNVRESSERDELARLASVEKETNSKNVDAETENQSK
jgi:hypothetical protein